jgi:hypothetical protein
MFKMGLHDPFGHFQHKLWQKERPGVKLIVWLLITKSWESTRHLCVQMECDRPLQSSQQELQHCFKPHPDRRYEQRVIVSQLEVQTLIVSRFLFGSLGTKGHLDVGAVESAENTIWGKVVASFKSGPWWILWIQGRPWLVLALKVLQTMY